MTTEMTSFPNSGQMLLALLLLSEWWWKFKRKITATIFIIHDFFSVWKSLRYCILYNFGAYFGCSHEAEDYLSCFITCNSLFVLLSRLSLEIKRSPAHRDRPKTLQWRGGMAFVWKQHKWHFSCGKEERGLRHLKQGASPGHDSKQKEQEPVSSLHVLHVSTRTHQLQLHGISVHAKMPTSVQHSWWVQTNCMERASTKQCHLQRWTQLQ